MQSSPRKTKTASAPKRHHPGLLRQLISAAMELERRTMQLYCRFENMFPEPAAVQAFWLDMAEHESRHYGALALVAGLLESAPGRTMPAAPGLTGDHIERLRDLLSKAEAETERGVSLTRAFEIALVIEGSEIEDLVLDLLTALKGEEEHARAVRLLIHDLGDLSYMIEKYAKNRQLLARADRIVERHLGRLRGLPASPPAARKRAPLRPVGKARKRAAR